MSIVRSQNSLNSFGSLTVKIRFKVVEMPNREYIQSGRTAFYYNVRKNKKVMLTNAMYNAVKTEFPSRTVTPYDITIISYYYTYYFDSYEIIKKEDRQFESYSNTKTSSYNEDEVGKYEIKQNKYKFIPNDTYRGD